MAQAPRDENRIPTLLGVSSADGTTPVVLWADPTTHRLLVDLPSGTGDVVGPASSTDNAVVRFNSTTGKLIQNSAVIIDDSNNVTGVGNLTIAGDLIHTGDTNNLIAFTTDTQTFKTGGSSRMDITDSGVRLGAANARVTTILDQDDMSSNSATALSTQQSIKAYVDSQVATSDTLQEVFDNGQTITIANTDNQTLALTQNDTTNNPVAMTITNTGTGNSLTIDQNGATGGTSSTDGALFVENTGNTGIGLGVYSNIGATSSAPLVNIHADNTAFDQYVVSLTNDGAGGAMLINTTTAKNGNAQNLHLTYSGGNSGGWGVLEIDNNGTSSTPSMRINHGSSISSGNPGLAVNIEGGAADGIKVKQDGTGNAITIDQNGNVGTSVTTDGALHIENTGNTGIGLGVYTNIGATAAAPLVKIFNDNTAFDQPAMVISSDATGDNIAALEVYGDVNVADKAQLWVGRANDNTLGLTMGYHDSGDYGYIYAVDVGIAAKSIWLNANGSNGLSIGDSATFGAKIYIDNNTAGYRSLAIDTDVTNSNSTAVGTQLDHTSVVTDAGTYTKTGAALQINSNVTETSGTITDSAIVLDINQTHADATGDVVNIENDGTGNLLYLNQDGALASGKRVLYMDVGVDLGIVNTQAHYIYSNINQTTGGTLFRAFIDNASSAGKVADFINDGTGNNVFIDQNGNGIALNIDSEATSVNAIKVDSVNTSGNVVFIDNNGIMSAGSGRAVLRVNQDHASSSAHNVLLWNDGTGLDLFLDQNGNGTALSIDSEATTAPAIIADIVDGDAHLRLVGDSGNGSPTEGDFWRESDGLKYYNGTTEVNLLVGTYELDMGANSIGFTMQTATGDGTTTIDWGLGNHFDFTFGAQNDTFTFTAPAKPGVYTMSLKQDSTGSRTATWPASVKWPGGSAPTLTTTATTGYDTIGFRYDGTNYYGIATLNFS